MDYDAHVEAYREHMAQRNDEMGRAAIYKACCRVLKNTDGGGHRVNQFSAARQFATYAEIIHDGYFEIGARYTKNARPFVVTW